MKNDASCMLDFLSKIDVTFMLNFFQSVSKEFGKDVVNEVMKLRSTLPNERFTKIEQLYAVKGLGETGANLLLASLNVESKYPDMIKGRDTFTFSMAPVIPKAYIGQIALEAIGPDFKEAKERTYLLYYNTGLQKEEVHEVVKSLNGFLSSQNDKLFLIQDLDNGFLVPQVNAPGLIYSFGPSLASKFRIYAEKDPAYLNSASSPLSNSKLAVAFEHGNDLFPGQRGILRFDSSSNKVVSEVLNKADVPTSDEYFDIAGIIGKPSWAAPDKYKSFTIMTHHGGTTLPNNDPREFIQKGTVPSQVLEGTNKQNFWEGKTGFRYVEVIENVRLRAINNQSHTGVENNSMYLHVDDNGVNPDTLSTQYVAKIGSNLVPNIFLDMFVFYGCWDERANISCRVMFRAKTGGRNILSVTSNDVFKPDPYVNIMQDALFCVEEASGYNNVFLKTNYGKYLKSWRNSVVVNEVVPTNHEEWHIVIP